MDTIIRISFSCIVYLLIFNSKTSAATCPSLGRKRTDILATAGETITIPCSIRVPVDEEYLTPPLNELYWFKYTPSAELVLSHNITSGTVTYGDGYVEAEYMYNPVDSSLSIHNVSLLHSTCYSCFNFYEKYVYDTVGVTTGSTPMCNNHTRNRHMSERTVVEGENVSLECPLYTTEYDQQRTHYVDWYRFSPSHQHVLHHIIPNADFTWHSNFSSLNYSYSTADGTLTIPSFHDDYTDCYQCRQHMRYSIFETGTLIVLDAPDQVQLTNIHQPFSENRTYPITCALPFVNPGIGYVIFTIKVDGIILSQSDNNTLVEVANSDGSVSVTYEAHVSVTRVHNGQSLWCEVVWMSNTTLLSQLSIISVLWPPEPAHNVTVEEITSQTAALSWISGHSGGSTQTFLVQYKAAIDITYKSSPSLEDTGFGEKVNYTIIGLEKNMFYNVRVISSNLLHKVGSDVITFRTPYTKEMTNGLLIGLITGGVLCLIVVVVAMTAALLYCKFRNNMAMTEQQKTINEGPALVIVK